MLIDKLNKKGNGTLYLMYHNDYQDRNDIGTNLSYLTDPTIISFTPGNVRIYKNEKMMNLLDEIVKSEGLKGFLNYFNYHKAFHNPSLHFKIVSRSNDNTLVKCTYKDTHKAILRINEESVLLEFQNIRINSTNFVLYHGTTDSLNSPF
ncbi:MAG: hypothetical protein WDZ80_04370 [Candidatus Paceibacterota bacterium]